MTIELAIVSINYKTADLTLACINSVLENSSNFPAFKMYIIDNFSDDGSAEKIAEYISSNSISSQVELIAASKNGGYAFGNNLVFRKLLADEISPKYVWLLNPDTEVGSDAAMPLIHYLDSSAEVAVVGSRLHDKDGTPQLSAFRFPSPINEFATYLRLGFVDKLLTKFMVRMKILDQPHQADWLAGASFMLKSEVIREIGLMDEQYFLYFEEVDYCISIKKAGYEIWYVPESTVYHAVGASTKISDNRKQAPRRPQYWFDSRHRYYLKNYGKIKSAINDILSLVAYGLWNCRKVIQSKESLDPPHFLSDLFRNSVFVRGFTVTK